MIRLAFGHPLRLVSALCVATLVVGPKSAGAAPPAGGAPPSPPTSSSAQVATPPTGTESGEEASVRFKRGLQLFDEGDYTLALVEFERAYQLAPNYRALYNIALVNMQLGRYADAVRTLDQYLHDGAAAISADRQKEVAKSLAELKLRTATVDVSTNVPGAEVTLDGKPIEAGSLQKPLLIDAGEHTLRATAAGFQPGYRTVTLAGADRVRVRLDLVSLGPVAVEPVEERGRAVFWPGFVVAGGFAAGAVVSGVVMLVAKSHYDSVENQVGSTLAARQSAASAVNSAALVADVLTGLTVVTGGVSLVLSLRVDHSAKTPAAGTGSQQIVLSGTF
jgi:hypothetical protein